MGLGSDALDTATLFTHNQKLAIQYTTIVFASISVISCAVSLYWFTVMRRNFRRTLILLLLISDLYKSIWFLVFPVVSISVGGIESYSPFCDAGGFSLQAGIESCDVAILMMSLHMSLQLFNSHSSRFGPDGLYRVRYLVYAVWIFVPCGMAAIAFVRSTGAYLSQGAFCTLPIRPFWYRLALSWIPRYLVWIYITAIAIRIYLSVGNGFKVFARQVDSTSNPSGISRPSTGDFRRLTIPTTIPEASTADPSPTFSGKNPFAADVRDNVSASSTVPTPPAVPGRTPAPAADDSASRQRAIQRQTRLLFIYPVAYMIMMIFPFVQHCFNYSDYYAQHPIFWITLIASICYSMLGAVDVCIFCWREKPWRLIPGRDGTVLGSFGLKRVESGRRTSRRGTVRLFRGVRSDRNAMAAEMAAERLKMERAAAAANLEEGRGREDRAPKEWFDRKESFLEETEESGLRQASDSSAREEKVRRDYGRV